MIRLMAPHGSFELNNRGWGAVVMLGWDLGWKPAGTEPPEQWQSLGPVLGEQQTAGPMSILTTNQGPVGWPRADYVSGRGQLVTAEDAANLAGVLESIVDDLPSHDPIEGKNVQPLSAPGFPVQFAGPSGAVTQRFELFGGRNKPGFVELIAFLRKGGFRVW